MMGLTEIFARMNSGELAAHSEMGTRDENKQAKSFGGRLQQLRTTVDLYAHVLAFKDVVLPFNPFTCEADNIYNAKKPFRPILLVSQVLTGIKEMCAKDADLAKKWNDMLGTDKIDWSVPPTMDDYYIFKNHGYIKPRVMSYSTVTLNFGGRCGMPEHARKYLVDASQLGEGNTYEGDNLPWHQRGAIFFHSILKQEADAAVAALEAQAAPPDAVKSARSNIMRRAPIGFVNQTNLIPFLYFPINACPDKLDPNDHTGFERNIRWMARNMDKWGNAIEEAMTSAIADEHMDVFDFTLRTPTSKQMKPNKQVYTDKDSLELYQAMTITVTDGRSSVVSGVTDDHGTQYKNSDVYASIWEAAKNYFAYSQEQSGIEGGETFEKIMAMSHRFRPISSVEDKILAASHEVFLSSFSKSPYFTEEIKKANSEFFIAMNPDNALALAAVDDDELEEAAATQKTALADLISESNAATSDSVTVEDIAIDIE